MRKIIFMIAIFCGAILPSAWAEKATSHIEAVDAAIVPLLEAGHIPGAAVAILDSGEVIHIGTYGFANLAHQVPITSKTVFELASLTKQMTAIAIMTLAKDGQLSLGDEISDYIDVIPPEWEGITIDQLLSHMAGLAHRFEAKPNGEFLLNYTTADMLASAKKTSMVAEPGTDWSYSDQGYFLLGMVIEAVTDQAYFDFMQARFFEPLGMDQTLALDQAAIIPHLAQGYIFNEAGLQRGRRVWQFGLTSHFGVISSLDDMIAWEAELSNTRLIDETAMRETWEIQRHFDVGQSCRDWGYARGWWARDIADRIILDHAGYSGTAFIRDVSTGLSVIVLTNRELSEGQIEPMQVAWAAFNAIDPSVPANGYRCWE